MLQSIAGGKDFSVSIWDFAVLILKKNLKIPETVASNPNFALDTANDNP